MQPRPDDDLPASAEDRRASVQFTRKQASRYRRAILAAEYGADEAPLEFSGHFFRFSTGIVEDDTLVGRQVVDVVRPIEFRPAICVGMAPHPRATAPPCCDRAGEYNGFGSDGPTTFTCPNHCPCHD